MWHVKCGFDAEDETSNFGTRAVTVGLDGLFETNTIATIESSPEDGSSEAELDIKSALNPQFGLMVTIDNALIILNKNCTEVKRMVSFEYNIDCFLVSQNGLFIFVGLANASFHCLSIRTGQLVFTRFTNKCHNWTEFMRKEPTHIKLKLRKRGLKFYGCIRLNVENKL